MKRIITLIILLITVMSCSELAEMEAKSEQIKRERGWECRYSYRGEIQGWNYMK